MQVPGQQAAFFWAAYILDTEISLSCGIPPLLHEEYINAPLPREGSQGEIGGEDPSGSLAATVFSLRADLASIKAQLRKQLNSAKASRLTDENLIQEVSQLASALDM